MKNLWNKILTWVRGHRRRVIQLYTALLYNANFKAFFKGGIYQGDAKYLCLPGFNCYSCPGAIGSCPLGSLQNALESSNTRTPVFLLGCIMIWGLMLGRTICGFFCPVGFFQEIIYKIKTPKVKKSKWTRIASYLKYVILFVFVIGIPIMYATVTQVPGFCKYICPVGTLEGAVVMLLNPANGNKLDMLGPLFTWKFLVLMVILVLSVFFYRFFCRFICPLGAIYGFFAKFCLFGIDFDEASCTNCGLCLDKCKMDIKHVGDHECINCGECIPVCPVSAIKWKGEKFFLAPNAVETPLPASNMNIGTMVKEKKEAEVNAPVTPSENPAPAKAEVRRPAPKKYEPKKLKKPFAIAVPVVMTVVLAGAIVYFAVFDKSTPDTDIVLKEGDSIVEHEFELFYDKGTYNTMDSIGKISFLNFWYMDCAPCKEEIPHFNELYNNYSEIVDVTCLDAGDPYMDEVADFLDEPVNGNKWWNYSINFGYDKDKEFFNMIEGSSSGIFPVTVVIDKTGIIDDIHFGGLTYSDLENYVTRLNK
ncbi:MAG: 4Fe-4S binding protein [Bacilli bacterium]|nr:4Fe-4S binding protein [Bacilli bacterium]